MEPDTFALSAHDPALTKTLVHGIVERRFEKYRCWPYWVGTVGNYHIVFALVVLKKLES